MFLILSQIPVSPESLYGTVGVLCLLLTVGVQVVTIFRARQPQPFLVKADDEYVKTAAYHTHCKINRQEHARIEAGAARAVKSLEERHHDLSREVSTIAANEAKTAAQLTQMSLKLDRLLAIATTSQKSS